MRRASCARRGGPSRLAASLALPVVLALPVALALPVGIAPATGCGPRATGSSAAVAPSLEVAVGRPDAVVDLGAEDGARLVSARWRFVPATLTEVAGVVVGPDLRPVPGEARTLDLSPRPRQPGWEDAPWTTFAAQELGARRGTGHVSMGWYRVELELPERLGELEVRGATIAFEITVDDYAEVWVDGQMRPVLGERGGPVIAGWNAPNRVVLTRDAVPGARYDLAVLAINGPLSRSPGNFYWVGQAVLDVYRARPVEPPRAAAIERVDLAAMAELVPESAALEPLAAGFQHIDGAAWSPDGTLLFSDPRLNVIHRFSPELGRVSVFRTHSGYAGIDLARHRLPGSSGLAIDREGRLLVCEHGRRRLVRLERSGAITVLAQEWRGRRLNGPDAVVVASDGSIFFTDPRPAPGDTPEDPALDLDFSGLYRIAEDGSLSLLSRELAAPGGLALSPDERFLHASSAEPARRVVLRWPLRESGSLGEAETLIELAEGPVGLGGLATDERGDLYLAAPEGVRIHAPDGRHLGTVRVPDHPLGLAWGDTDRRTLYVTARESLHRIRLAVGGVTIE